MSKKLRGIGVQLVGFFVLAILIPTLILAFRAIETTKSAQTENLKLTSVQTLQETKMGFTNYLKNISQPIDLLTRNDAVKHLEDRGDYDTNVTTVQDALIASVKVTNGAERAYFSTVTGHLITGWTEWDNTKNKLGMKEDLVYHNDKLEIPFSSSQAIYSKEHYGLHREKQDQYPRHGL